MHIPHWLYNLWGILMIVVMKTYYIFILIALFWSCNKSDEQGSPSQSETFFPTSITVAATANSEVTYRISYNQNMFIEGIETIRTTDGDTNTISSTFMYNSNHLLSEVQSTNIADGSAYKFLFSYNDLDAIESLSMIIDTEQQNIGIKYLGPATNSYELEGDEFLFPTAWDFDENNVLQQLTLGESIFNIVHDGVKKGPFYDIEPQPALVIWHTLFFYLAHYELLYFSPFTLNKITTPDDTLNALDKVWDEDKNLVSFKLKFNASFSTILYTISYEQF